MADTPGYQEREVESNQHVPGRETAYFSLLPPWIYSRGHGRQQTCTEYGNDAHGPREPLNPDAHHSKRGGMPLTCQINILFNRKWSSHVPTFYTTQKRRQDWSSTYLGLVLFDGDGSDSAVADEPDHAVVQSREMMKREDH